MRRHHHHQPTQGDYPRDPLQRAADSPPPPNEPDTQHAENANTALAAATAAAAVPVLVSAFGPVFPQRALGVLDAATNLNPRTQSPSANDLTLEAINRPNIDWQEKIRRGILRRLRNISETP